MGSLARDAQKCYPSRRNDQFYVFRNLIERYTYAVMILPFSVTNRFSLFPFSGKRIARLRHVESHDNANRRAIHAPHVRNEPSYANSRTRNSVSVLIGQDGCVVDIVLKSLDVLTRATRMYARW